MRSRRLRAISSCRRTDHGVSVNHVRKAVGYAERQLGIQRLLLSKQLMTNAGQLFLERYGALIDPSGSGQLAMRKVLEAHLQRVEWDGWKFPVRLFPFLLFDATQPERPIVIDPSIAFGRPVVLSRGITTAVIAERIDAGESVDDIAADYDLAAYEMEHAILYPRAA